MGIAGHREAKHDIPDSVCPLALFLVCFLVSFPVHSLFFFGLLSGLPRIGCLVIVLGPNLITNFLLPEEKSPGNFRRK